MASKILITSRLRGSIITINESSYRLIRVFRRLPNTWQGFDQLHNGTLRCLHGDPQFARLLKKGGRSYLLLGHVWLQTGHKGVMTVFAEVRRIGRVSGENRWLRVHADFPHVPAAATAERVAIPWRRREKPAELPRYVPTIGPVLPIEAEELYFGPTEVQS